jgi:hypothetical protein
MKPISVWLPMKGYQREIIIAAEHVESIILRAAEHEAGHIIAAYHFGALGLELRWDCSLATISKKCGSMLCTHGRIGQPKPNVS